MLNELQRKILRQVKINRYSPSEIAAKVGCHEHTVEEYLNLDPEKPNIKEFEAALKDIDDHIDQRTQRKMKVTRELLINKLNQWIKLQRGGEDVDTKSKHKMLVDSINALTKTAPDISVTSYTWKQGMTMEDALSEYKRLTAMARGALDRRRVQGVKPGRSAEISGFDGQVDELPEAAQDIAVPAQPKTRKLP